ncbi:hypothetical protein GALMADRAFT_143190 [Galerina marginata CBS 339.88]|uniref:F-box domain-containing protein n=1 Tax=Galerina marginata (strain CBS 339.88) TaxID=685588 RepID=A0A067SZZ7_GALM3|nr:hypothetical protein GALMADRAFT_143190 [Galerina marginata CBS 339.88]
MSLIWKNTASLLVSPPSLNDSPSIFNLPSDILWHIFSLNADMRLRSEDYEPALDTLRHTSQVCSSWRELALASPLLWSRVINIACFLHRKAGIIKYWSTEVMKRTQTGLLDIKAKLEIPVAESIAEKLLSENWERIRSVYIYFRCTPISDGPWRAIFQRPAPMLESFYINCEEGNTEPTSSDFVIFKGEAPLLQDLWVVNLALDLKTVPWASNLRHIDINSTIPTSELLRALFIIPFPFLESIDFESTDSSTEDSDRRMEDDWNHQLPLRPISLPFLDSIVLSISEDFSTVLTMLGHITPSVACVLRLVCYQIVPDNSSLDILHNVLPKYLRYAAGLAPVMNAYVWLTNERIAFFPYNESSFFFDLWLAGGLQEKTISTFLSCLKDSQFRIDELKTLSLEIESSDSSVANESIAEFVSDLTAIEHLDTNTQTLNYLDRLQRKNGVVACPSLQKIGLNEKDGAFLSKTSWNRGTRLAFR